MKRLVSTLVLLLLFSISWGQTYNMANSIDTVCGGSFYDNGGPSGNYSANRVFTHTFYSSGGQRLQFAFNNFQTRNIFNYLEVHDGPDRTYPLLGKYFFNAAPSIIRSTGNSLTFHFVSNGSSTRYGWSANISCFGVALSPQNMLNNGLDTTCATVFYDNGGSQGNYQDSSLQVHTFCSDSVEKILIADFNAAVTSFAIGDTLWAFDGSDTTAPPLGIYLRNSRIETLASTGSCLTFKFKSDSSSTNARGWQAAITCDTMAPPPNNYLISTGTRYVCEGVFFDNGGSGNYPDNTNLTQTLRSYNGNRLIVDFRSFITDNIFDYLEIHDGPDRSFPLIGKYYFTSQVPDSITSTDDALTFHWVTSGAGRAAGWVADISCGGPPLEIINMSSNGLDTTCNGAFYDNGGKLGNYKDTANLIHTLCADEPNKHLKAVFNHVETAFNQGDTLWAYDGSDTTAPLLGIYVQGSTIEPLVSSSTCLTFRFYSDSTLNSKGWQAEVSCDTIGPQAQDILISNGSRYLCEGTFYDNGGSGNYPDNSVVTQTLRSFNGNRIKINFRSFVTDNIFDYLEIHDGPDRNFPLVGKYYFTSQVPDSIISSGDALTFHWVTSGAGRAAGWVADISCEGPPLEIFTHDQSGIDTICSGVYYDDGGFNLDYQNNQNTVRTFCSGDTANFFYLRFNQAALDLRTGDTLIAYDGTDTNSTLIGKYITQSTVEPILSRSGCLTLQFKSDSANKGGGWQAFFHCDTSFTIPEYRISTGHRYVCEGTFTDDGGANRNYSNSFARTQTFHARDGNYLQIIFSSFVTDNIFDDLRVYDGSSVNAPQIGRYFYNTAPDTITSSSSALTFSFSSNSMDNEAGWLANMQCINNPPLPQLNATTPLCAGNDLLITANTLSGVTYHWIGPNGFTSSQDTLFLPMVDTSNSGLYRLFVEKWGLRSDTASIRIIVNATPSAPSLNYLNPDTIFCQGDTAVLNSSYSFGNRWKNGDTTQQIAIYQSDTVWAVHIDQNTCISDTSFKLIHFNQAPLKPIINLSGDTAICQGDSIRLNSSYTGNNLWSNGDTAVYISVQQNGMYYTQHTDSNGCKSTSDTVQISTLQAPNAPVISVQGSSILCQGDSLQLQSSYTTGNRWITGDSTQGIWVNQVGSYSAVYVDTNGCVSDTSNQLTITQSPVPNPPTINILQGNPNFCQGDSVILGSSYTSNNLWNNGDTSNQVVINTSGSYFVHYTNANNCKSDTSIHLTVNVQSIPNQPNISLVGNDSLDAGVMAMTYQWLLNDTLIVGLNTKLIKAPSSGNYRVVALNDSCASDTSASYPLLLTGLTREQVENVTIYPNPSSGLFQINFGKRIITQILVYDQHGKVIINKDYQPEKVVQIDLQQNANGIYLLRLISAYEIYTYKLIKH